VEEDNKKLRHENTKLLHQRNECEEEYNRLHKIYGNELRKVVSKHEIQMRDLQRLHEELRASDIRSISSIGTGLEAISDETFERKFRRLHDDVCFCP
jgi:predicted nuclease with TOPRIM domain